MATHEPHPSDSGSPDTSVGRRRGVLGCIGGGAAGGAAVLVAIAALVWLLGSITSGCDLDLDFGATSSPGPGTRSEHLDVTVAPVTGLHDGSSVGIRSQAFAPRSVLGVAVCLQEADTERQGVDACDEIQGVRFAVGTDGVLDATYPVPRLIRVGGKAYDCGARPKRCLVVAADASDYDRSGGSPVTFDADDVPPTGTPPTVRPQTDLLEVGGQPEGPVPWGTEITVVATGFEPGEPLLAAYCSGEFEQEGPQACEPVDADAALNAVMGRGDLSFDLTATEEGGASVTLRARRKIRPILGSGEVDCRTAPGGCAIVIAAAADTKRSAVHPYTLEPD